MENIKKRDAEKAAIVAKVARITGASKRQVYRVIGGDSNNELIMSAYMEILEGENRLVDAVKKLVPFN